MKKVVIFGGSGFLGSYVADELTQREYDVLIADVKESMYLKKKQSFIHCDIMISENVVDALNGASIVYNFAGLADIDQSIHQSKTTMEQNVIGNINILEACKEINIERFIYASSAYAFSDKGSFYGISKLASEKIIEEYEKRYNLPYSIVRYGSLYGERADEHNGMYRILRSAVETGQIIHRGTGEEMREYIHAADAAKMSVDIIEKMDFMTEHIILTGVEKLRHKDLLQMIQEILNNNVTVSYSGEPWEGHFQVTPYSYHPTVAKKLVSNSFIELGQGLVSCIRAIDSKLLEGTA